jgi:hypothetical protein
VSESSGGTNSEEEKESEVKIISVIKWLSKFLEESLEFDCSENDFVTFVD